MTVDSRSSPPRAVAVEVSTPARLHFGMLSFGVPGCRSYGGLGVLIDRPRLRLRISPAKSLSATGPLAARAADFARACAKAFGIGDSPGCAIEVLEAPPSHAGLGSGTQLGLAVAAGVRHLHRGAAAPPASDGPWTFGADDALVLARAAGRGRRSCVGVHGFSGGGLVVEGGRFVPAGVVEDDATRTLSPLLARVHLPEPWRWVVCGLCDVAGLHGDEEKRAFADLPPVPREVSAELSRIALLELVPAAVEGNFSEFAAALFRYGRLAGKPFEPVAARLPQAAATARLLECLVAAGAAGSAQSSWGPTVAAMCGSQEEAESLVTRVSASEGARGYHFTIARSDPRGAILRDVSGQAGDYAAGTVSP